jgi:hypothetical protein
MIGGSLIITRILISKILNISTSMILVSTNAIGLLKLHYTKQLLPSLIQDCGWKMPCSNWQGEEVVHFHLPTACDMFLLIRASDVFEMEEYFLHLNSILNQDPTNLDTFLFKLTWIKKNKFN